jgi:plastocyanin
MTLWTPDSTRRRFLSSIVAGATLGLAGCTGTGGDGNGDGTETPENTVRMVTEGAAYYFDPIGLSVDPGTTVTFVNVSGRHSSTAYHPDNPLAGTRRIPDGAEPWDSTTLTAENETFDHTFEVEGTYDYYCIPHKSLGMIGRIVVGQPGGPAEGSMPPDGKVPESQRILDEGTVSYDAFVGQG